MNVEAIPIEVEAFLAREVRSLLALELLLLLGSQCEQRWTVEELSRELRATVEWAERELARLSAAGLVSSAEAGGKRVFGFAPAPPAGAEFAVGWLVGSYPARRFSIIQALYAGGRAGPTKTVPGGVAPDSLRHFADAFEIRKDGGKGEGRKEPPNG